MANMAKTDDDWNSDDHTGKLPDELIVSILSYLSLKEAGATSVLSSRWRHLWTYSTLRLDFDGTEALNRLDYKQATLDRERDKYVGLVNNVLRSCQSCYIIEEFRVYFNLDISSKESIDKWIMFALSRDVQRLELNLTSDGGHCIRMDDDCYTFPHEFFSDNNNEVNCKDNPTLKPRHVNSCISYRIKHLRALSLTYVRVSEEDVQYFLCNCPVLELLSVSFSKDLKNLKICDPSLILKHLNINHCKMRRLEIRNTNIISLRYHGRIMDFALEDAPLLVHLHVGGGFTSDMPHLLALLSDFLPQLETFSLEKDHIMEHEMSFLPKKFNNLKHLVVEIFDLAYDAGFSLPLLDLICASPCLQKLELQADWDDTDPISHREIRKVIKTPHSNLKQLEFRGYFGHKGDVEFVTNIVANAPALEKIVIDPHYRLPPPNGRNLKEIQQEEARTRRARRQLKKVVPAGIELRVLDL